MKKAMAILGIALLVAAIASVASDPVPIEQKLISIQAREALPGFDDIGDEPVDVQAAILDLGGDPLLLLKARRPCLFPQVISIPTNNVYSGGHYPMK